MNEDVGRNRAVRTEAELSSIRRRYCDVVVRRLAAEEGEPAPIEVVVPRRGTGLRTADAESFFGWLLPTAVVALRFSWDETSPCGARFSWSISMSGNVARTVRDS